MSSRYASTTQVTSYKSRDEIERTLSRYGATAFAYGWTGPRASIQFEANGRRIRFVLPLPGRDQFKHTPTGRARTASSAESAYEQAVRQSWRALALVVKAKLEAVEAGITTFEEEFLPHTVLPSGKTVAEELLPQVEHAYAVGSVDRLQIEGTS